MECARTISSPSIVTTSLVSQYLRNLCSEKIKKCSKYSATTNSCKLLNHRNILQTIIHSRISRAVQEEWEDNGQYHEEQNQQAPSDSFDESLRKLGMKNDQ